MEYNNNGFHHHNPRDLMSHVFFQSVDWEALLKRECAPPYVPEQGESIYDTCNFDNEFTKIAIEDNFIELGIENISLCSSSPS